jgi:hypothetical protein
VSEPPRWQSRALGAFALLVGAACGARWAPTALRRGGPRLWERAASGAGPSRAIFPTQTIPLRFDHARHLAIGGVTCERCHASARTSERGEDRLLPDESVCAECHAIDRARPERVARPAARCDACHEAFDPARPLEVARVQIPPPNLKFSHGVHARAGVTCEGCHGRVRGEGLATRFDLPSMATCVQCHQARGADTRCASCHLAEPDGVLRTRFEEGWLNPPSWMSGLRHDPDFWWSHREVARADSDRCTSCHRERECVDCHDGRLRDRRTHPNDYLSLHAVEARMGSDRCASCHRAQTFCEGCHRRSGVAMRAAPASRGGARFHAAPDVWSGPIVSEGHHAIEARRALGACVSCHAERDCTSCHGTIALRGAGLSPHPPGFSALCGSLLRASSRGCTSCHADVDALRARCD